MGTLTVTGDRSWPKEFMGSFGAKPLLVWETRWGKMCWMGVKPKVLLSCCSEGWGGGRKEIPESGNGCWGANRFWGIWSLNACCREIDNGRLLKKKKKKKKRKRALIFKSLQCISQCWFSSRFRCLKEVGKIFTGVSPTFLKQVAVHRYFGGFFRYWFSFSFIFSKVSRSF